MRWEAYGCAALAVFALGCDSTRRVDADGAHPDTAASATTPARQKSDALITMEIQSKFFASSDVKGHRIDVDTRDAIVKLQGTVDQENERKAAEQIARSVEGVARVENQLLIRPIVDGQADAQRHHASDEVTLRRNGRAPAWITSKIQSQYYLNPELKPWQIDVDTSSTGMVTLSGAVDSDADRTEAVRIARTTEGVVGVTDNLRVEARGVATTGTKGTSAGIKDTTAVKSDAREVRDDASRAAHSAGTTVTDSWITMKIQSKYFVDDDVRARNIDVDTQDGQVTLKGSVESEGERQHAVSLARSTEGVTRVHDNLVIERTGAARRDVSPRGADSKADDALITMKVQSKYYIHDEIKARKVDVDTSDGIVTLKGSVPSDEAKKAAEVIAADTAGVSRVVNNLTVEQ
jgi:osmotically-inducible protein OsmY